MLGICKKNKIKNKKWFRKKLGIREIVVLQVTLKSLYQPLPWRRSVESQGAPRSGYHAHRGSCSRVSRNWRGRTQTQTLRSPRLQTPGRCPSLGTVC